jgi:hypothetical protein
VAHALSDKVQAKDLSNLDKFKTIAKLQIDGEEKIQMLESIKEDEIDAMIAKKL